MCHKRSDWVSRDSYWNILPSASASEIDKVESFFGIYVERSSLKTLSHHGSLDVQNAEDEDQHHAEAETWTKVSMFSLIFLVEDWRECLKEVSFETRREIWQKTHWKNEARNLTSISHKRRWNRCDRTARRPSTIISAGMYASAKICFAHTISAAEAFGWESESDGQHRRLVYRSNDRIETVGSMSRVPEWSDSFRFGWSWRLQVMRESG